MFTHILRYKMKSLLHEKDYLFWNFGWPILLVTLIFSIFQSIESGEVFQPIPVGTNSAYFQWISEKMEYAKDRPMFQIIDVKNKEEALKEKEIEAFITGEQILSMEIYDIKGENLSMIQTILNIVNRRSLLMEKIFSAPGTLARESDAEKVVADIIEDSQKYVNKVESKKGGMGLYYLYVMLAMTCLGASTCAGVDILSVDASTEMASSKRNLVSGTPSSKIFLTNLFGSYLLNVLVSVAYVLYTRFVLGGDYGQEYPYLFLSLLIANLIGVLFGAIITLLLPKRNEKTISLIPPFYIISCFVAGMMSPELSYKIEQIIPWITKVNPATVITKLFFGLYHYGVGSEFYEFLFTSIVVVIVMMGLTGLLSKRLQK